MHVNLNTIFNYYKCDFKNNNKYFLRVQLENILRLILG